MTAAPRVLFFLDSIQRGGRELLIIDICNQQHHNFFVPILGICDKGDALTEITNTQLSIIKFKRHFPLDLGLVWRLRKVVIQEKITIIHSQQAIELLHSILASIGLQVKNVCTVHGVPFQFKERIFLHFLTRFTAVNITVSHALLDQLRNHYGFHKQKFFVLHNAVHPDKFQNIFKNIPRRNYVKECYQLGTIANFVPGKDPITICRALAILAASNLKWDFFFIGRRDHRFPEIYDECWNFCQTHNLLDRVHFLGSRNDIPELLSKLDIFVLSSLNDSFGISLVEAMIMGVPCIVSDITSLREVTNNGNFARLFKTSDPLSLAYVILDLTSNPLVMEQLSLTGRDFALSEYGMQKHLFDLNHIYAEL